MLLAEAKSGSTPKRPFELQKDRDLWQIFWESINLKGPHSIKLSKVKGHAKDSDVESGVARRVDKEGNDAADEAADEGVNLHGEKVKRIANLFDYRQQKY